VNSVGLAKLSCANASPKTGTAAPTLGGTTRCFDVEAYKDGQKFRFSVKTRNHTTHRDDIKKDYYNLFFSRKPGDPHAVVNAASEIARGRSATPMWAAVRVDTARQRFDIYYGRVIDLPDKRYIPMDPSDRLKHLKLTQAEFDSRIKPAWSNVRRKSVDGVQFEPGKGNGTLPVVCK
jgi:hypothetical protein